MRSSSWKRGWLISPLQTCMADAAGRLLTQPRGLCRGPAMSVRHRKLLYYTKDFCTTQEKIPLFPGHEKTSPREDVAVMPNATRMAEMPADTRIGEKPQARIAEMPNATMIAELPICVLQISFVCIWWAPMEGVRGAGECRWG